MSNPYQRSMFFFTYIKGELVEEWVTNSAIWLLEQVFQQGQHHDEECLCNKMRNGFTRQFTNALEQEQAHNKLRKGITMGTNVDEYIAKFETLVWKAGYDLGDYMVIQVFTNGLPVGLYEKILTINNPHTYKGWRRCILKQQ